MTSRLLKIDLSIYDIQSASPLMKGVEAPALFNVRSSVIAKGSGALRKRAGWLATTRGFAEGSGAATCDKIFLFRPWTIIPQRCISLPVLLDEGLLPVVPQVEQDAVPANPASLAGAPGALRDPAPRALRPVCEEHR